MLRLIKNELAKIFYKKSTYVIIVLGLLLGIGLSVIHKLNSSYDYEYMQNATFENYIDDLKHSSDISDKAAVERYEYLISIGLHNEDEAKDDWRSYAAQQAYSVNYYNILSLKKEPSAVAALELEENTFREIMSAAKNDDYKAFYQAVIDYYRNSEVSSDTASPQELLYYEYCLEHDIKPDFNDWRVNEARQYTASKYSFDELSKAKEQGQSVDLAELSNARDAYLISQYRLDHNIENSLYYDKTNDYLHSENDFISSFLKSTYLCTVVAILMSIIAGGIIANEFSSGTIKFLLINPVKRAKIFWSKYLSCIIVSIAMLLFFFGFQFITSMIINGANGINGRYIYTDNNTAYSISVIWYVAKKYVLASTSVLTTVTLAFTISSLLRSSSIAIALSLGVQLAGSTIVIFLVALGQDWGRYLLFANTNLDDIMQGGSLFPNHSLTFALVNIAVYMVIFLLTAYDGFTRREV